MKARIYGNGIVLFENCLTDEVCDGLINFVKPIIGLPSVRNDHLTMFYKKGTKYSEVPLSFRGSEQFFEKLSMHISQICQSYFDLLDVPISPYPVSSFNDPMVKCYSASSEDKFILHYDSSDHSIKRSLSLIWYLNDLDDGGETVFPWANIEVKPQKGACIAFPPFWNFPHLARKPAKINKLTLNSFGSVL